MSTHYIPVAGQGTFEFFPVDGLATGAVSFGEVTTLQHKLKAKGD